MKTGSGTRNLIALIAGILVAYVIADVLSSAFLVLFQLKGPAAMVASIVFFAAIFFAILHLLQKYAHIVFFGFGGE
jgi:hypothetical protein